MRPSQKQPNITKKEIVRASVATAGNMLARICGTTYGNTLDSDTGALTKRDVAILRFFAAIGLIESDLWQQYDELGRVTDGPQNPYQLALQFLDDHGSQYITSSTLDEISHSAYLNAYLESEGADPKRRIAPWSVDREGQLRFFLGCGTLTRIYSFVHEANCRDEELS